MILQKWYVPTFCFLNDGVPISNQKIKFLFKQYTNSVTSSTLSNTRTVFVASREVQGLFQLLTTKCGTAANARHQCAWSKLGKGEVGTVDEACPKWNMKEQSSRQHADYFDVSVVAKAEVVGSLLRRVSRECCRSSWQVFAENTIQELTEHQATYELRR